MNKTNIEFKYIGKLDDYMYCPRDGPSYSNDNLETKAGYEDWHI